MTIDRCIDVVLVARSSANAIVVKLATMSPSRAHIPLLRNHPHLGLLVAGLHFHAAPIFLRCSSTRAASVATSPVSCGSGVA